MNPEALLKLLQDSWQEGDITLDAAKLENSLAAQLLNAQFPSGKLDLHEASQPEKTEDNKNIFIREASFDTDFFGLRNLKGRIDFFFTETNALRLKIDVHSESVFKMAEAFPGTAAYSWSQTEWHNPAFTFDSDLLQDKRCEKLQEKYGNNAFAAEKEKEVIKGLVFTGDFSLGESWNWIGDLIGVQTSVRFSGPIEHYSGFPRFYFSTNRFTTVPIGHLQAGFAFDLIGLLSAFALDEESSVDTNFNYSLDGQLKYKLNEEELLLPIRTFWGAEQPALLNFTIETEKTWTTVIGQLAALFKIESFTGLLPDPAILPVNAVVLKTISFTVGFSGGISLKKISAGLGMPAETKLELFPGLLKVDQFDIKINYNANLPVENAFELIAVADTEITYCDQKSLVRSSISFPELEYSIELVPETQFDLAGFAKALLPAFADAKPLICDEFYIGGNFYNKSFRFDTHFNSDFSLEAIYTKIIGFGWRFNCKTDAEGKRIIDAELGAVLELGKRFSVGLNAAKTNDEWTFTGSASVADDEALTLSEIIPESIKLPDEFLTLEITSIDVEYSPYKKHFSLDVDYKTEINLGIGKILGKGFKIQLNKKEGESFHWEIEAKGIGFTAGEIIRTENSAPVALIDIQGDLKIEKAENSFVMSFNANPDSGWVRGLPLLIPAKVENENIIWSEFDFQIASISLTKKTAWEFKSKFDLKITRTWDKLQKYLSGKAITVELLISTSKISLELVGDLLRIEIPELKTPEGSGLPSINLGKSLLAVSGLTLSLENKKHFRISSELRYFLPEHLNTMFGKDESENPFITIFKTYKPGTHDQHPLDAPAGDYLGVKFFGEFDGNLRVGASISSIPVVMLSQAPDEKFWAIELGKRDNEGKGELGSIWIKKGEISFNAKNGGFVFDVGWKVHRDPRIPLTLVKELLKNSKLPHLGELLPPSVPIPISNPPQFIVTRDNRKYLNTAAIKSFLQDVFGYKLPEPIERALDSINDFITDKLPDDFVEYLEFLVPPLDDFNFKLTISPTGSVDLAIKTGKPVRILLPGGPGLTGVTISEVSVGMLFGGSMMKIFVDAHFDTFPVQNLAAAILSYIEPIRPYLGNLKKFRSRLYLNKTTAVLFTQFPVPIPLFYEKIGVEFYGIGDFEFQSTFSLPAVELDLAAGGEFLINLIQFFKDKKFPMPVKDYKPMDLQFTIGPNFVRTGEWLGKKTIGLPDGIKLPSIAEAFSRILNFVKFLDIESFISVIPVDHRMKGDVSIISNFMGMNANGSFLLTTPNEFIVEKIFERWTPSRSDSAMFMRIMPGEIKPESKGLIVFLSGDWQSMIGEIKVAFGIIAVNTKQFGTGFRFSGTLGGFFKTDTEAYAVIQPNAENPILFEGKSRTKLQVAGINFFDGELQVAGNKNEFAFSGMLNLNDVNESLQLWAIEANLKGVLRNNYFNIEGHGEGRLLIYKGRADIVARYENNGKEKQLTSSLLLTCPVGTFSFILNPTPFGFQCESWLDISNKLLMLRCTTELYQNNGQRWIKFDLFAEPAGGLIRLVSNLRLDFGSAIGVKGSFNISLLGGTLPLFTGDCFYQIDYLRLKGTVNILNVLSGSIEGTFSQGGFSIGGSVNLSIGGISISSSSITITERGVSISFQAFGLPPLTGSLRANEKNELILCGPTFWINFTNGKFDLLHGCSPVQAGIIQHTYPMAGAIFYRSTVMHHALRTRKKTKTKTANEKIEDKRYIFSSRELILFGQHGGTSVKAERTGAKLDFFTELHSALRLKYPDHETDELNITKASIDSQTAKTGRHVLILRFPKSANHKLKQVNIELKQVNHSDELMPQVLDGFKDLFNPKEKKKSSPVKKKTTNKKKKSPARKTASKTKSLIAKKKKSAAKKAIPKKKAILVKKKKTIAVKKKKGEIQKARTVIAKKKTTVKRKHKIAGPKKKTNAVKKKIKVAIRQKTKAAVKKKTRAPKKKKGKRK